MSKRSWRRNGALWCIDRDEGDAREVTSGMRKRGATPAPSSPAWPDSPVVTLGAKLYWFFDYNAASVSGGLITSVIDQKAGTLSLEDSTTARQPAAVSEVINGVTQQFGRSTLSTHGLRTSTTSAGDPLLQDAGAQLFIVHREGSPVTIGGGGTTITGAIVSSHTFTAVNVDSFGFNTVSSQSQRSVRLARAVGTSTLRGTLTSGFAYVANEWCCTRIHIEPGLVSLYRNGSFLTDAALSASRNLPASFGLGFGYAGGPRGSGAGTASAPLDIAYAFLTTATLTAGELAAVSAYTTARSGVAA